MKKNLILEGKSIILRPIKKSNCKVLKKILGSRNKIKGFCLNSLKLISKPPPKPKMRFFIVVKIPVFRGKILAWRDIWSIGFVNLNIFNLLNGIRLIKSKNKTNKTQITNPTKTDEIISTISEWLTIFLVDKYLIKKE